MQLLVIHTKISYNIILHFSSLQDSRSGNDGGRTRTRIYEIEVAEKSSQLGVMQIFRAPRLFILSRAFWKSSSLNLSVTIPFVLTFPLSKYATARGKQYVCEKDPMIYRNGSSVPRLHSWLKIRTLISSPKIFEGGQCTRALSSYTP